eukprot:sb/3477377/
MSDVFSDSSLASFASLGSSKRYSNPTYNSRHGKRRNFQASSYIQQVADIQRQKEQFLLNSLLNPLPGKSGSDCNIQLSPLQGNRRPDKSLRRRFQDDKRECLKEHSYG